MNISETWSRLASGEPTTAIFAGDAVVLGDTAGLVVRIGMDGRALSERPLPAPIHQIAASPDGRLLAVACGEGELVLLDEDGIVFRKSPGEFVTMAAMGSDAGYALALAPNGKGFFFNRYGREMGRLAVPDGADSLALVPASGQIITTNCDGVVQCFAPWGKPLWRVELSMDAGRVATDERGDLVLVPVFTYGATALTASGLSVGAYDVGEPVGAAASDGKGGTILLATLKNRLVVLDRRARVQVAEKFPSPVKDVALSRAGDHALVITESGYTHLLAFTPQASGPLLEISRSSPAIVGGNYLFRRRIFSPEMMLMSPRAAFADDASFVVVAGGGGRAIAFDLAGDKIQARSFRGNLLDLKITRSGAVRVITTRTVLTYRPGERGGHSAWSPAPDLFQVSAPARGPTVALSEAGDLFRIDDEGFSSEHLFTLPPHDTGDIRATESSIAVALKSGDVLVHQHTGEVIGQSGTWPSTPRILAAGVDGYLISVEKLILMLAPDGAERWRYHLATPPRYGVALPGAFLVIDEPGAAFSATASGIVRRTFSVGRGTVTPYPDSGEGPGFLKAEGKSLCAIHPDGRPRWRCRLPDEIAYVQASNDGRLAGVISGLDFYLFALTRDATAIRDITEASRFLEFADG